MRWRLLGLFLFAAASVVAWTFWIRPEAEIWLKGKIESVLSARVGQEVRLASLSLHPLLLRVSAEGVRVGPVDDPTFTCRRWTFHTAPSGEASPLTLFFLTFARSDLDRPFFRVPIPSGKTLEFPEHWWRNLPFHRLTWTNGAVQIPLGSERPLLSITHAEGSAQLSPGGFLLNVQGDSPLGKFHVGLTGLESLRPGAHLDVTGEGRLEKAPLDSFSPWCPAGWGRFLGEGDLSAMATVKDLNIQTVSMKDVAWELGARLKGAIWFPPGSRPKDLGVPFEGEISFQNGRGHLKRVRLFRALDLSGSVTAGPGGPLNLAWRGNKMVLADLAESGLDVFRSVPSRGTVDTEGTLTGTLDRPVATWTADLRDVGYPGLLLPELNTQGQWQDDGFSLKIQGLSGQVEVDGTPPARPGTSTHSGRRWTLRASHLDLAQLARRNGWPRVGGLLAGSFSLLGSNEGSEGVRPEAEGTLRIDDFTWGVHQETAPVQGQLLLDRAGLRVKGIGGAFDLDVRCSSGVWRVERLAYDVGGLQMWGRGFLRDGDGNIQLDGGLQGLSLMDVPPLAKRFPSVEGRVSTEGRWHGKWGDSVFNGAIRVDGVRWRPGGPSHRGEADLRGGRGGVTVTRFQWDDHVRGEGAWLFGKGGHLSVDVDRSSGNELFDFFTSSGTVGGVVSGKVSLSSGDRPGLEGWARLRAEGGHWGNVPFEETKAVVYFRGPRVDVESVEIRQSSGSFQAAGEALRRPLNPTSPGVVWDWRGAGECGTLAVGSSVLSGTWTARGFSRLRDGAGAGDLKASAVLLARRSLPQAFVSLGEVRAKYFWSPTFWRLEEMTTDRGVRAEGEVLRDSQGLTGRVHIKDLSLLNLFPALSQWSDVRFGRVNGEGLLTGSWSHPHGEMGVTLTEAGWKDMAVGGDAQAIWTGTLEVPRVSLRCPEGGTLIMNGTWDPGSSTNGASLSRLEGRLDRLSLGPLVRSLGLADTWRGFLDGHVSLERLPESLKGQFEVGGQLQHSDTLPLTWRGLFRVSGSTATVETAVVTTGEGRWSLRPGSTFSRGTNGVWDYHLKNELRNIHLGPLQIFGGVSLDGQVFSQDRTVAGRIEAESLWMNQRVFDKNRVDFRLSTGAITFLPRAGTDAFVEGRVRLNRWPQTFFENLTVWDSGRRILALAGELGPTLWDFSLQGWGLQAETFMTLADFDWPISGPWTVKVRGKGSLGAPEVQAEIVGGPGHIGPFPYDRLEAQAHWVGEWVDVRGLRLSRRKGYLLTGEGRFPVRENVSVDGEGFRETDFNLHLTDGKLAVLKEVWPLCRSARGTFFGDLRVEPGKTVPRVTGSVHVKDGSLDLSSYAPRVRELNGEVSFQNDRARVEHARARVGSGWIEMAGDIGIHGLSPVEYDLSIQSDGRRGVAVEVPQLSVPPGPLLGHFSFFSEKLKGVSSGEPWVSLRVKGPHGQHVISGTAVLEGTHFTYPPSKDSFNGMTGPRWWRNFWRLAAWDIQFKTGKETWYRNEYVNVRLDGALRLAGRPGDWAVNGRVGTTEGAINYLGQIFQVKRGAFEIVTETRPALGSVGGILPFVSGEAERVVTTVDPRGLATDDTISMVVDRSLLGEIQPRFVSRNNPDLKSDRVAMKALGLSSEQQGTPADRDQLFRAGLVQLVGSSAAPLANRLAQKLGIGIISPIYEPPEAQETVPTVAPATPSSGPSAKASPLTDYLKGAGASARIRLTDRLSGVYKVKLDEAKNQTFFRDQIELVLRLRGSVYVRASSELDSKSLLGQPPERRAVLENQWRFGLPKRTERALSEPVK